MMRGQMYRFFAAAFFGFSLLFAGGALIAQAPDSAPGPIHVVYQENGVLRCRHGGDLEAESFLLEAFRRGFDVKRAETVVAQRPAAVTFDLNLTGFTPEAEAAFMRALEIWQALLEGNVPIRLVAEFTPLPEDVLGQAGPLRINRDFANAPAPMTWFVSSLADQIVGTDLSPGNADICAQFNSNAPNWYFGLDANPGQNEADFVSVALHELAHGLGFLDSSDVNGSNGSLRLVLQGQPDLPFMYDNFLQDSMGGLLLDLPNNSMQLRDALISGDVFWGGPFGSAANGGPPELYAPNPYEFGSSIAHLDEDAFPFGNPNALMTPSVFLGEANHDPGPVTLGMFRDMGWTVQQASQLIFAQFGNGGANLVSDIVLVNPSSQLTATGQVQFWDPAGALINSAPFLPGGEQFEIPPQGTRTLSTTGGQGALVEGSVTVDSDIPLGGVIRFFLPGAGVAGVGASQTLSGAIAPVRRQGGLDSGVAVRNMSDAAINVDLTLKDPDGNMVATTTELGLEPNGRFSRFITEIFDGVNLNNFTGSVLVQPQSGQVAVIALELDFGGNTPRFTTLPVTPAN